MQRYEEKLKQRKRKERMDLTRTKGRENQRIKKEVEKEENKDETKN